MSEDSVARTTRALMNATLRAASTLLELVPPSSRPAIDRALAGGAKLKLEVELPDVSEFALVLVEREGRRHVLQSVSLRTGPEQ